MQKFLLLIFFNLFILSALSQITEIAQSNYTVQFVSSDNTSHPVAHAFDGDVATWWALYNDSGYSLPGIVEVNLGSNYDVTGFSYLPNDGSPNTKTLDFEIYTSNDGSNWGSLESAGTFNWIDETDVSLKEVYFGAISSQYVKVIYLTNTQSDDNIHTGELILYQNDGVATGQENQVITFDPILTKGITSLDFDLTATSNSGLPISFEIVSGPATVSGATISLTGSVGFVEVKALQEGNSTYYPTEQIQTFEVIDLATYFPEASTRLTADYPIEMSSLMSYPIYINASIDVPDNLLNLQQVTLVIDGTTFNAESINGFYYYNWTPLNYGNHTIEINAIVENGNTTTINRSINVVNAVTSQTIRSLEEVVIEFGGTNSRWYYGTYSLPQFVGTYNAINALFDVACPAIAGGCDDWDRWAHIDVKAPDGNWIQIIRYITPYGVACNHELDVTDYSSLLQGEVEFRVFIDTWGTGGWELTLDFDYNQGTPTYLYSNVKEVWDASYAFGDPSNLQPVETFQTDLISDYESSHLRLSNTGHGWGGNNTSNAAEFFNAYHFIDINENQEFTQHLWTTCNPNPDGCTGQQGTWQYNRAGWCPGTIAPPDVYNLNSFLNMSISLDYRFHPSYIDHCHPNNPDCVSGTTCSDCNDGYNPVYFVDAHLINWSNSPIIYAQESLSTDFVENEKIYNLNIYPNPSNGIFSILTDSFHGLTRMTVNTIEGTLIKAYYFSSSEELNNFIFNLSDMASGIYFINIENAKGTGFKKIIIK